MTIHRDKEQLALQAFLYFMLCVVPLYHLWDTRFTDYRGLDLLMFVILLVAASAFVWTLRLILNYSNKVPSDTTVVRGVWSRPKR